MQLDCSLARGGGGGILIMTARRPGMKKENTAARGPIIEGEMFLQPEYTHTHSDLFFYLSLL